MTEYIDYDVPTFRIIPREVLDLEALWEVLDKNKLPRDVIPYPNGNVSGNPWWSEPAVYAWIHKRKLRIYGDTVEITPDIRFSAYEMAHGAARLDRGSTFKAWYHASHAESRPESYTQEAVAVSKKFLLVLAADEPTDGLEQTICNLLDSSEWYAH